MRTISLSNVHFSYPREKFSICVDALELREGSLYIFTGKNGGGKTTLLKLCCGILKTETGNIDLFGRDINSMSLGEIGQHISYLFQEPSKQLFATTVWDEMLFASYFIGEDMSLAKERAISLLKKFNLYHLVKRSTYRLSRGEKQRLAIATILMKDIKFLILDEPTTGLDYKNRQILYDVVDELHKGGKGIAIISHDNELISRFASATTITLHAGKISNISNKEINCESSSEDKSL